MEEFGDYAPMSKLAPVGSGGVITGLSREGTIERVACPTNPATGEPWGRCQVEWDGVFVDYNGAFALRHDGTLVRDGVELGGDRWLAISVGPMALNALHELVALDDESADVHTLSFDSVPTTLVSSMVFQADFSAYRGGCVLEEQGRVTCAGDGPYWTDSLLDELDGVRQLSGGNGTVCAWLQDDSILCHDGSTYDFGPLVAFDALGFPLRDGVWEEFPAFVQEPTVCAITTANTIECEGARVDDVLREQLAEVNRRYGDPAAL